MLHKTLNVKNQLEIQQELADNFPLYLGDINSIESGYRLGETQKLKLFCPKLANFLIKNNLYERWVNTGISIIRKNYQMPVHSDQPDVPERIYALNIPIFNCQNSVMVWYNVIKENLAKDLDYASGKYTVAYTAYPADNVREIDRANSNSFMFVNVKIPHNGINFDDKVRCIMSLRFKPDLTLQEIENFQNI